MAYIDCPSCGQRVNGRAPRCPQCGLIFTPGIRQQAGAGAGLTGSRRIWVVAGVVVVVVAAVVVFRGLDLSRAFTESPVRTGFSPRTVADDTSPPPPVEEELTVAAPPTAPARQEPAPAPRREEARPVETPPAAGQQAAVRDTAPPVAQAVSLDTTPAIEVPPDSAPQAVVDDTIPAAVQPPTGGWLQRYARTWVSIREARNDSAAAVRTLSPGEAVRVDSLSDGWYRVVVDGVTEGYVEETYLTIDAP